MNKNNHKVIFCFLSSRTHMIWVRFVGGSHSGSVRYSSNICYNIFPLPEIDDQSAALLEDIHDRILLKRSEYPLRTMAQLYDPDHMPDDLLKIHEENDRFIESLYRDNPFKDEEEILDFLISFYEKERSNE